LTFNSSLQFANDLCRIWNSQKNPPKAYSTAGKRIHHYQVGLGGIALSWVLKNFGDKKDQKLAQDIAGFSTGLFMDDFDDFVDDAIKYVKSKLGSL